MGTSYNSSSLQLALVDLTARINVIQFAIEALTASHLATASPAQAEEFKSKFVTQISKKKLPEICLNEQGEAFLVDCISAVAREFTASVSLHEAEIRRELDRRHKAAAAGPQPGCGGPAADPRG